MWDIAVGQIDPASPALEIVCLDDSGHVYLVQFDGAAWSGTSIWQNQNGPYFAVIIADVQPQCPGEEIVVAGQSGEITLIAPKVVPATDLNCDDIVNGAD